MSTYGSGAALHWVVVDPDVTVTVLWPWTLIPIRSCPEPATGRLVDPDSGNESVIQLLVFDHTVGDESDVGVRLSFHVIAALNMDSHKGPCD